MPDAIRAEEFGKTLEGNRQQKRQFVVFDCVTAGYVPERAEGPGRYVNVAVAGGEGVVVGEDHRSGAVLSEL